MPLAPMISLNFNNLYVTTPILTISIILHRHISPSCSHGLGDDEVQALCGGLALVCVVLWAVAAAVAGGNRNLGRPVVLPTHLAVQVIQGLGGLARLAVLQLRCRAGSQQPHRHCRRW